MSAESSFALSAVVPEKRRVGEITPITVMKAIKNSVEIEGKFIFNNSEIQ